MADIRCNLFSCSVRENVICYESQLQVEEEEVLVERKFVIMSSDLGHRNFGNETEVAATVKRKPGRSRKKRNPESVESIMQSQENRRRSARQRKQRNLDLPKSCCSSRATSDVNTTGTSTRKKRRTNTSRKKRSNKKSQQPSKRQKISTSFFDDIREGYPNNKENHYVEKILGCAEKRGRRYVIVKWKNVDYPTIIDESKINEYVKNLLVFHHLKEITRIKKKDGARSKPTGRSCDSSEIRVKTETSSEMDYRSKQSKVFEKETPADRRVDIKIEND